MEFRWAGVLEGDKVTQGYFRPYWWQTGVVRNAGSLKATQYNLICPKNTAVKKEIKQFDVPLNVIN